jgi:DNA-binding transcriptional LysR family regulator
LCVGAPESVLNYSLPGVLIRYRKLYPKVELTFLPYWDISLVQSIENGKMDLAVWMKDEITHPNLKSLRLRSETVLLVAGRDHPLASAKKVHPHDLTGQTLLLTESGCAYRKKLDQLLALRNIRPGHVTEFSTVEAIKRCASLGMGIALLPKIVVAKELERKQLASFAWAGPNLDIATHVVWHKDKWISPAQQAFVSLLEEMLGDSAASKLPHGKNGNRRR